MKYIRTWIVSVIKMIWLQFLLPQLRYCVADTIEYQGICIRDTTNLTLRNRFDSCDYANFHQIPYIDMRGKVEYMDMVESSNVFVDKSLFIKRVLDTKQKVILINCPSRTGKSINLSMLKAFFEIRVKGRENRILPKTETSTYKFFTKGLLSGSTQNGNRYKANTGYSDSPLQYHSDYYRGEFKDRDFRQKYWEGESANGSLGTYLHPPVISKYKNIISQHLGEYSVIHLDMADGAFGYGRIRDSLINRFRASLQSHVFLKHTIWDKMHSNSASETEKRVAQENLNRFEFYEKELDGLNYNSTCKIYVEESVLWLSKMLYEYFGKPVIILIDEYIQPLEYFLVTEVNNRFHFYGHDFIEDITILRNFLTKTLFENPYLKKAVLTGILSVNNDEFFGDKTDFVYYNAINNDFQEFYGFTENEVQMLFDHFKIPEPLANEARNFYRGYRWKPNTNLTNYNIRSIVYFLKNKEISDYWTDYVGGKYNLLRWLDMRVMNIWNVFRSLREGNDTLINFTKADYGQQDLLISTQYNADTSSWYTRIRTPPEAIKCTPELINCILSLLCEYGYLTNSNRTHHIKGNQIYVQIPNEEVKLTLWKPPK